MASESSTGRKGRERCWWEFDDANTYSLGIDTFVAQCLQVLCRLEEQEGQAVRWQLGCLSKVYTMSQVRVMGKMKVKDSGQLRQLMLLALKPLKR